MANFESPNTLLSDGVLQILDLLCEGPIQGFAPQSGTYGTDPLTSTLYDDVPVRNPDGSYNYNVSGRGFTFDYALGALAQTGITGFQKVETFIPLSSNTRVANPPPNAGPYKAVTATISSETYPDPDMVKVSVRVPALFAQDNEGNTNPYEIVYAVDISTNGGPFEEREQVTIRGKCTAPYQQTRAYVLPKPFSPTNFWEWKIRVRRVSQNILSVRTANDLYVDTIAVVSSSSFAYPNSVLVGTRISADQFSSIPVRAYEVQGLKVSVPDGYTPTAYNVNGTITPASYPGVWAGNFGTAQWTDNPAWVFYDLTTNARYGLGDYIPSSSVDKWSLYRISQFCDRMIDNGAGGLEPTFTFNAVLREPREAYSVMLDLASVFRGMLYYANGTINPVQDQNLPPVYAFNNSNVVDGTFNYADTSKNTRSTVAKVKWVDPTNNYRDNVEYVEDVDGILRYGYQEKDVTAFACTSRGQAYRLGSWTLQSERLLTETVTFQTTQEGVALAPGDNFAVYDNFRMNRNQAGRILGFTPGRSAVTLDRPVIIDPGYTYTLSCIIPKFQANAATDITSSSQIDTIRQSQVETFSVSTPACSGTGVLIINGSFSTGLMVGSPFVLSASGVSGVYNRAKFYTCLATAEVEPGKVEVLGLQANTGIQFAIQTGYTVIDWPTNNGDSRAMAAPTNLLVTGVTGANRNGTFFSSIKLTWVTPTPADNLSYYIVSGKTFDTPYTRATVLNTGYNFVRSSTGQYLFQVGAVSLGGVESSFITGGFLIDNLNPLGQLRQLSGVRLTENVDPLYVDSTLGYTGYIGREPGFTWQVTHNNDSEPIVDYQFISGYRLYAKSYDGSTTLWGPYDVEGRGTDYYQFTPTQIASFAGGERRGFKFSVDTIDVYGNVANGASLNVNNPPMKRPASSGFAGYNGGVLYNVTPSVQYDTSGIYLWIKQGPSFVPTFSNYTHTTTNLAGNAGLTYTTGQLWTWFSLVDTFGTTDSPIYGPVSGSSNDIFATFQYDISRDISGAFNLITGQVTNSLNVISGENQLTLQTVQGLSGQITGTGLIPGSVNTALNVRVNTAVVSSSGALSTQIDAVSARVETSGQLISATVGTLSSALATTGGALASWITNLGAVTSGQNASVQIGAQAFVTGSVNGLGGAAVATWGFILDANGKVVSMKATSTNTYGQSASFGTIVFGGANLQSENYVPGSAGWVISGNGDVEFGAGTFRGNLNVGSTYSPTVITANGFKFGGERIWMTGQFFQVDQFWSSSNAGYAKMHTYTSVGGGLYTYDSSNVQSAFLGFEGALESRTAAFINGSNAGNAQAEYAANVIHRNNTTSKYGLFVGTNWGSSENRIITAANVDASTAAVNPLFHVCGDGVMEYGTYVGTPSAVAGYITIRDIGGTTRKLAVIS